MSFLLLVLLAAVVFIVIALIRGKICFSPFFIETSGPMAVASEQTGAIKIWERGHRYTFPQCGSYFTIFSTGVWWVPRGKTSHKVVIIDENFTTVFSSKVFVAAVNVGIRPCQKIKLIVFSESPTPQFKVKVIGSKPEVLEFVLDKPRRRSVFIQDFGIRVRPVILELSAGEPHTFLWQLP